VSAPSTRLLVLVQPDHAVRLGTGWRETAGLALFRRSPTSTASDPPMAKVVARRASIDALGIVPNRRRGRRSVRGPGVVLRALAS
jgi:hypothetical protein